MCGPPYPPCMERGYPTFAGDMPRGGQMLPGVKSVVLVFRST